MATPTYTAIASITLGSSASSVTFSSIPQDYRDLVLVADSQPTGTSSDDLNLTVNNLTGIYTRVYMIGDGSAASASDGKFTMNFNGGSSNSVSIAQIMDYSATDKHKTLLARGSGQASTVIAVAGRAATTAAVTEIDIFYGGTIEAGSTFALWGIAS